MKKSRGRKKRKSPWDKLRRRLIRPQTEDEIKLADEYIASEKKRIKEEFLATMKVHGARNEGSR